MTDTQVLVARTGLATMCAAASVAAVGSRKLLGLPRAQFDRLMLIAFFVSRLGLFGLLFLVLRLQPRGDITIYVEQAKWLLQGRLPYRDFVSAYAPLYTYMNTLLVRLSSSGLAIVLSAILCEGAMLWVWLRYAREFFADSRVRIAAIFYLTSALSVRFVAIDGQNNAIAALTIAFAIVLLSRRRELLSGVCLGVGISAVKFLPLAYAPVFFAAATRRWRWVMGLLLCCVPVYGAFALRHLPILVPLTSEGNLRTSGNLPFVVESLFGVSVPSRPADAVVACVLLLVLAVVFRAMHQAAPETRLRVLTFAIAALMVALVLFSKKSWPAYLILCLFPLCLAIHGSRPAAICFAVFNIVGSSEPSIWWSAYNGVSALEVHQQLATRPGVAIVFFIIEFLQLAGYAWLLSLTLRAIATASERVDDTVLQPLTTA